MISIGSRGSTLALWQAEHVRQQLLLAQPEIAVAIEVVRTTGDRITDVPLSQIGDKGLFTKEVDHALLDGRIDLAVHSLKDVPTRLEPGLSLAAVCEREDPRDALIGAPGKPGSLRELTAGARVGTSSLRRRAQLLSLRPDLRVEDLRGNLDTRLDAVRSGKFDAIILALAGLKRLGRSSEATEVLGLDEWLPAVGQGALAIVCRADDAAMQAAVRMLDHAETRAATTAERALLGALEGGCQVPVGAIATRDGQRLVLRALVASVDGMRRVLGERAGEPHDAAALGVALADELLQRGAGEIMNDLRSSAQTLPQPSAP